MSSVSSEVDDNNTRAEDDEDDAASADEDMDGHQVEQRGLQAAKPGYV